jgi:nucleoid DNA-binding protein
MEQFGRNMMRTVKVDKERLMKTLIENRDKHVAAYNESVNDYKEVVVKMARANLKLANTGNLESIAKMKRIPDAPTSHEESYTKAIKMLEFSVESVIELEEMIFNQLVLDEWSWKHAFTLTSTMYKTMK